MLAAEFSIGFHSFDHFIANNDLNVAKNVENATTFVVFCDRSRQRRVGVDVVVENAQRKQFFEELQNLFVCLKKQKVPTILVVNVDSDDDDDDVDDDDVDDAEDGSR